MPELQVPAVYEGTQQSPPTVVVLQVPPTRKALVASLVKKPRDSVSFRSSLEELYTEIMISRAFENTANTFDVE